MPVRVGLGVASPDERILSTIRAVGGEADIVLFSRPGVADSVGSAATVVEAEEPEAALVEALAEAGSMPPSGAVSCVHPEGP